MKKVHKLNTMKQINAISFLKLNSIPPTLTFIHVHVLACFLHRSCSSSDLRNSVPELSLEGQKAGLESTSSRSLPEDTPFPLLSLISPHMCVTIPIVRASLKPSSPVAISIHHFLSCLQGTCRIVVIYALQHCFTYCLPSIRSPLRGRMPSHGISICSLV